MQHEDKVQEQQLILFSAADVITLADIVTGGELIIGSVGSGKTSMSNEALAKLIADHPELDGFAFAENGSEVSTTPSAMDEDA